MKQWDLFFGQVWCERSIQGPKTNSQSPSKTGLLLKRKGDCLPTTIFQGQLFSFTASNTILFGANDT